MVERILYLYDIIAAFAEIAKAAWYALDRGCTAAECAQALRRLAHSTRNRTR